MIYLNSLHYVEYGEIFMKQSVGKCKKKITSRISVYLNSWIITTYMFKCVFKAIYKPTGLGHIGF